MFTGNKSQKPAYFSQQLIIGCNEKDVALVPQKSFNALVKSCCVTYCVCQVLTFYLFKSTGCAASQVKKDT